MQSVQEANARLADAAFYFQLGEERTVGANSRLLLEDAAISWLNPLGEAGVKDVKVMDGAEVSTVIPSEQPEKLKLPALSLVRRVR